MERVFRNERHKELYEKFDRKRQEYFMVLGGATKEDAKDFSLDKYKTALGKKHDQCSDEDFMVLKLGLNGMKGGNKYLTLDEEFKPLTLKVLDNIDKSFRSREKINNFYEDNLIEDPVYRALVDLDYNVEEIHKEQFKEFSSSISQDEEMKEAENIAKYEMEFNSKKEFVEEMITYFERRGPSSQDKWKGNIEINKKRYKFLLENLVESSGEEIDSFKKEFIGSIPTYSHEGFYFWPEE